MKYIFVPQPPALPKKWHKLYSGRVSGLAALVSHDDIAKFLKKRASWNTLKKWLSRASWDKCWYCEASSSRAPFDVDHFRPKLQVTVDRKILVGHSGYHWLAYEWWNFRLSCQRCNRPEKDNKGALRGKANEFPVLDESQRSSSALASWTSESPRLLDPCVESDCELLAHVLNGEVTPSRELGTWEFVRARYTIDVLGLNVNHTPEVRRKAWQAISILIETDHLVGTAESRALIAAYLSSDQEYASFFRASISTHRGKDWVSDLLQAF